MRSPFIEGHVSGELAKPMQAERSVLHLFVDDLRLNLGGARVTRRLERCG